MMSLRHAALMFLLCVSAIPAMAQQRDAAFVQPNTGGGGKNRDSDEVVAATPKTVDVGQTIVGVTKRLTLFFTNFGGKDATLASMSLSADSNVRAVMVENDCEKVGKIKPNEKCSVGMEVTPNGPGPWTAELVIIHDAPGRVSRATVNGSTAGDTAGSAQPGLSLVGANKDQQIDFGDLESNSYAVRSVLLANDSPRPLTIKSINLVGADRSLTLMEKGGCVVGQEVPPGESCPVTVIWQPYMKIR